MPKIACIEIHYYYGDYYDPAQSIVANITGFQEVDDETFQNLLKASKDWEVTRKIGTFHVIELKDEAFQKHALETYVKIANERAAKVAKQKAEEEKKKAKKAAEKIAKLKKQLEQLEKTE